MAGFIEDALAPFKEGYEEAKAEEIARNTPISYWCAFFDDCVYSPRDFYALVEKNLERRQVPDLLKDHIFLHEGTVLSRRRLYFQMKRERIVAEICAAPFGTGFFISSRLFDRRQKVKLSDYVAASVLLLFATLVIWTKYGPIVATVISGIIVTTLWSLMRLAADISFAKLDDILARIFWFGPIYERWFHPNTYYRQDQHNMYREAVNRSVQEAVKELTTLKGIKPPSEAESRPILPELT